MSKEIDFTWDWPPRGKPRVIKHDLVLDNMSIVTICKDSNDASAFVRVLNDLISIGREDLVDLIEERINQ